MHFITNNELFEKIYSFFIFTNTVLLAIPYIKEQIFDEESKTIPFTNGKSIFKEICATIWFIIISSIISFILLLHQTSIIIIIMIIILLYEFIKTIKLNFNKLTNNNKLLYILVGSIICSLTSKNAFLIYLRNFSNTSHNVKEILLIIFIIFKIVTFTFFTITFTTLLLLNITSVFKKQLKCLDSKILKYIKKGFVTSIDRYKIVENKKRFNTSKIIFIIICPLLLIIDILRLLIKYIIMNIYKFSKKINKISKTYFSNSKKIILKIAKISTILALIIVQILIIYNQNIFSEEIANIYNIISTVILIPLIYDSISNKKDIN